MKKDNKNMVTIKMSDVDCASLKYIVTSYIIMLTREDEKRGTNMESGLIDIACRISNLLAEATEEPK